MLTKKDFKQFADAFANIEDKKTRNQIINECIPIFRMNNSRFDKTRFLEWIDRKVKGESTKGLG